jgi:HD-GYP domain-containing protein (c-di-GMP phosphodiesterase class II)
LGNSLSNTEVPTSQAENLFVIANALAAKDEYTEGHAQRVAIYSERLARKANLPDGHIRNICIGGMVHDIGKIGFSDRIFSNKAVNLSEGMAEEIRQHPAIGVSILGSLNFPTEILRYVLCHHEHVDGTGYPNAHKDDEIPLGAKIISIADCFDAITTDRPYQKRKSREKAFSILKKISGTYLCPELVGIFLEEIEENGMLLNYHGFVKRPQGRYLSLIRNLIPLSGSSSTVLIAS